MSMCSVVAFRTLAAKYYCVDKRQRHLIRVQTHMKTLPRYSHARAREQTKYWKLTLPVPAANSPPARFPQKRSCTKCGNI